MPQHRISFKLKNRMSELETLCDRLDRFCKAIGLSNKCLFEINLALEELFSNFFSYGFTDNVEHWITISLSYKNGLLTIRTEDDGMAFNPLEAPPPDITCPPENRSIGGLGIHLVKQLMDELVYERIGNNNCLTMKKIITT